MKLNAENLSLSITSAGLLDREFRRGFNEAREGEFVPRPNQLSRVKSLRRAEITALKENNNLVRKEIEQRANQLKMLDPNLTRLSALDLSVRSLWLETVLAQKGAMYGDVPYNFCITPLELPKSKITAIQKAAKEAFETIKDCQPVEIMADNPVEKYLNDLRLGANGARIDIIDGPKGPQVIEANLQWVDGIQALSVFRELLLGEFSGPIKTLASFYRGRTRLGIVNITEAAGSRSSGARKELEFLASGDEFKQKGINAEVIDPEILRLEYLRNFDAFYLNGDPKMFGSSEIPDWIQTIYGLVASKRATLFPTWQPSLDKKPILIEANSKSAVFVDTYKYSPENLYRLSSMSSRVVLKGDSFSSRAVAISGSTEFEGLEEEARFYPDQFVIQPEVKSAPIGPVLCWDTSADKPVLLKEPKIKYNVWIIGGEVVGIMASLSDKDIISDKDFNTVPIPK